MRQTSVENTSRQPIQLELEHENRLQTIAEETDTDPNQNEPALENRPLIMIPVQQGPDPVVVPAPYNLRNRANLRPPVRYQN